jgi:hypothetical protein
LFVGAVILDFILAVLFTVGGNTPSWGRLAYHLLQFSLVLPHFLFLANGVLLLYFSLRNSEHTEIVNYSSIISLGSVDYAVMAYNGVLSSGKMVADQIVTPSSFYDFRVETNEVFRGSRRVGSIQDGK